MNTATQVTTKPTQELQCSFSVSYLMSLPVFVYIEMRNMW